MPSHSRDGYAEYSYRRKLGVRELLPAVGMAIGAGLFAFYVARLLIQRTPLAPPSSPRLRQQRNLSRRAGATRPDAPIARA